MVDAFSKGCAVINSNLDQSQIQRYSRLPCLPSYNGSGPRVVLSLFPGPFPSLIPSACKSEALAVGFQWLDLLAGSVKEWTDTDTTRPECVP